MAEEVFSVSSVITAFWPVESYATELQHDLQVGRVQKFVKHTIKIMENNCAVQKTHILCTGVVGIKGHYGTSAIVCKPITYADNVNTCQYKGYHTIVPMAN